MECMEARALKSSFSSELAMKTAAAATPQSISFFEDIWCVTGIPPTDEFSIDEFFDLPNDDTNNINNNNINGPSFFEEDDDEEKNSSSFSPNVNNSIHDPAVEDSSNSTTNNSNNFSPDLAIPDDDVQELELWSHLMDDSIPEPTLACPNPVLDTQHHKTGFGFANRVEPVYGKPVHGRVPFIPSAVPVKPRSKRSRSAGNRSWGLGLSPRSESPSSSTTSSPVSILFYPVMARDLCIGVNFPYGKPSMKKPKKKPDESTGCAIQRRCSHCQVTKTPQWRAGPNGPKTLCNACGVRFKSGRLFPEYRPACSPTFSSEVHSNSHRKVLEMRKKKESYDSVSGPNSMVLAS